MPLINLLPWREQLYQQQKRQLLYLLAGSLLLALSITGILHIIITLRISNQEQVNIALQQKAALLSKTAQEATALRKQKAQITAYTNSIHNWQRQRVQAIELLNELTRIVPDGVFLSQLKRQGELLTLEGDAESRTQISLLMSNVETSQWLKRPVLNEIDDRHFILQLKPQS